MWKAYVTVSIGFVLSHEQFSPPRLLDLGVRAEQAGFDMVWTSDHFHPWMHNQGHAGHAWVTLAALGQRLERIPLGTGVTCPTYRYHPAVVAQAFASLAVLYPGRIFLGVGTGEAVNEEAVTSDWGDYDERAARLVEAVTLIRQLWTGDWVDFDGEYYQTKSARLYTTPDQPIPLFIAAEGPNSMELAGRHGDGLISDADTASNPEMRREFEEGARAAGKSPGSMPVHAENFVFVGEASEADHAAKMWRFLPKAWDKYVDMADPRRIMSEAEQDNSLEQVKKMWVIGPDAQTHIDKIKQLADGGVTHIYIHSGQQDQERFIDFYGREVLPHIDHEIMRPTDLVAHELQG